MIQANDARVMDSQQVLPIMFTPTYGGRLNSVQLFMTEIRPMIKNGESIGVIGQAKSWKFFQCTISQLTDAQMH